MNSNNYHFILADYHKGNKVLAVIKGKLSVDLVSRAKFVDDGNFNDKADQLKHIINTSSITGGDGDKPCK